MKKDPFSGTQQWAWQRLYNLSREKDLEKLKVKEQTFLTLLGGLPADEGSDLATYLKKRYFTDERRAKWSLACRPESWLVNHNMHVESWHKKLKCYWFGGMANKRTDRCLLILWVSKMWFVGSLPLEWLGFWPDH